jgi:hypothetical protein
MSTTFADSVIINNTLDVTVSGAQTASFAGTELTNNATSSTASVDKVGVKVASTGTWSGTGARNFALKVEPAAGGTTNWSIWSGDSSGFSSGSQFFFAQSQNVFAIKNGPNALAPACFLSESNNGNEITSLNAVGVATDGATDIVGLWGEAHNVEATLASMAAIQASVAGTGGSVTDAVCFWAYHGAEPELR